MPTDVALRTAAQLFMVGIPGPSVDEETRRFLAETPPGGVILFKRNVRSPEQLRDLVADLHATGAGVRPLVSIDHEGGRVDRLPRPFTHFPPMATVAEANDPRLAEAVGLAMGRELNAVGIDLDFAPVLDVWSNPRNRVIGDRAFGTTPARVSRLALAFARGLRRAGVIPCGKHFPGHGATLGDSHFVLPRLRRTRAEVEQIDLVPFVRATRARIPAIMTAHVVCPALDRRPATLSRVVLQDVLRRRLGFRGVVFSDDMEMQAMAGRRPIGRNVVLALQAGCDMVLACQSLAAARSAIAGAADALARGALDGTAIAASLARIQRLRRLVPSNTHASRLRWPTHDRLARRLAGAAQSVRATA